MSAEPTVVLHTGTGPFLRSGRSAPEVMRDVAIALLPAVFSACWFFGRGAWIPILVCVLSSIAFEWAFMKIVQKKFLPDGTAALTGLLLALNLPPALPVPHCILGSFIAIVLVKQIFGGLGKNLFNPALSGRLALMALFPVALSRYVPAVNSLVAIDATTAATPLSILKSQGIDAVIASFGSSHEMLRMLTIGGHAGSIGETSVLALIAGGIYLMIRRVISWHIPVAMYAAVALVAFVTGPVAVLPIHLLGGGLALGAFFMATDYTTSPSSTIGKLLFGFGCGALLMAIRLHGSYPEGCMFAILAMNLFTPLLDRITAPRPFGHAARRPS